MIRSVPKRVKIDSCSAISWSVPLWSRPPISEYSPSLFSRMISMSMSPGFLPASGDGTPSNRRTGRTLAYCWKSRRIGISSVHSDTGSGTVGQPMAPRKIASWPAMPLEPVLRHHAAEAGVVVAAPVELVPGDGEAPLAAGGIDDAHALGDDFLADSVARNDGDPEASHLRLGGRRHAQGASMISFP